MRPIQLASTPLLPSGVVKTVSDYAEWRQDLLVAYGHHCAYCNIPSTEKTEVEHVIAKTLPGVDELEFTNLLLACGNCNRPKSNQYYTEETHVLPQVHNSVLFFEYSVSKHPKTGASICLPKPAGGLSESESQKATSTIRLMELDKVAFTSSAINKAIDRRAELRYSALEFAQIAKESWDDREPRQSGRLLELIKKAFESSGFFGVWYKTFSHDPEVLEVLRDALPGTALGCWGPAGEPLPR